MFTSLLSAKLLEKNKQTNKQKQDNTRNFLVGL